MMAAKSSTLAGSAEGHTSLLQQQSDNLQAVILATFDIDLELMTVCTYRLGHGTVKSAAWLVLAEAGPQGLSIAEIAKQIHKRRLRDLTTSRTPEVHAAHDSCYLTVMR